MEAQLAQFSNRGMNQDISVSKATNEFAFKNYNIRITAVNDNTLLSVTNEKGPIPINVELKQAAIYNKLNVSLKGAFDGNTAISKLIISSEYTTDTQIQLSIELKYYEGGIVNLVHSIPAGIKDYECSLTTRYKSLERAVISSVGEYDTTGSKYSYYTQFETKPSFKFLKDTLNYIPGTYLGHAIINNNLVLFTHEDDGFDYIISLQYDEAKGFIGKTHYIGNINFSVEHPIETLPYYESELVQKVYWVDGINQPRVINIASDSIVERLDTQFDFNPTITKFPEVTITKEYSGVGLFPSGVIQYFISYYNKYGAETGIIWNSDLNYISTNNRGESPDKNVVCSFRIKINNVDTSYDYLRIYSLQRTSINNTPIVKVVADIPIDNDENITYIDTNNEGHPIDPTSLFFIGGSNFIASTIAQKDNTLFLGDIEVKDTTINSDVEAKLKESIIYKDPELYGDDGFYEASLIEFDYKTIKLEDNDCQLNNSSSDIKTFKSREIYRFSLQFKDKSGSWSIPIWIGDKKCTLSPYVRDDIAYLPTAILTTNKELINTISPYYTEYRLLIASVDNSDRSILSQGIVSPTVFNFTERVDKTGPYSIASWITRLRNGNAQFEHLYGLGNGKFYNNEYCEIQNSIDKSPVKRNRFNASGYILSYEMNNNGVLILSLISADISDGVEYKDINESSCLSYVKGPEIKYPTHSQLNDKSIYDEIINFINTNLGSEYSNGLSYDAWSAFTYDVFYSPETSPYFSDFVNIPNTSTWVSGYFTSSNSGFSKARCSAGSSSIYAGAYTIIKKENKVEIDTSEYSNNFYVDNSIVNFFSPDLEDNTSLIDRTNLSFRIIGIAPLKMAYSDIILETNTPGIKSDSGLNKSLWIKNDLEVLVNAPLYKDYGWDSDNKINKSSTVNYYLYLWNKKGSIIGQTKEAKDENGEQFNVLNAELKHKIIANKKVLNSTTFLPTSNDQNYDITPTVFNSDAVVSSTLKLKDSTEIYQGNYENLLATPGVENSDISDNSYRVFWNNSFFNKLDNYIDVKQYDPVHIKYKTSPHSVFELIADSKRSILPRLIDENPWDIKNIYTEGKPQGVPYPWFDDPDVEYYQSQIGIINPKVPYLFIGEIYRHIPYRTLYGGYNEEALKRITWIPASKSYPITSNIAISFGDTYYQRWDCLTTVPYTEDDMNSVVDITSFMVETHINLDGRYDKNKDVLNIINARIDNFNNINTVYSQEDNFFTYNILDEKFNIVKYKNQVAFSLSKEPSSDIDTWTNISLSSAFNLNGLYGKLNKIINFNDALITFQDKAVSVINFNNRTALSTESGVPIEIANSGKVNGYTVISSAVGCENKNSICQTSSGVYFIDALSKSLFSFNKEGLNNLSTIGMSQWFKNNLTGKEYLFYDAITHDIYLVNSTDCLVYNEDLQNFTSFMDYQGMNSLFNIKGHSIALKNEEGVSVYKMFGGKYNTTFKSNIHNGYFVEYKVNPEPLIDKIFGSIEYIADSFEDTAVDNVIFKEGDTVKYPFETLEVWNEYQKGTTTIKDRFKYPNFEKKFRIWRVDIPRDDSNGRDRIRNPWSYIKLSKLPTDNYKTVFHSLLVKYYK